MRLQLLLWWWRWQWWRCCQCRLTFFQQYLECLSFFSVACFSSFCWSLSFCCCLYLALKSSLFRKQCFWVCFSQRFEAIATARIITTIQVAAATLIYWPHCCHMPHATHTHTHTQTHTHTSLQVCFWFGFGFAAHANFNFRCFLRCAHNWHPSFPVFFTIFFIASSSAFFSNSNSKSNSLFFGFFSNHTNKNNKQAIKSTRAFFNINLIHLFDFNL